MSVPVLDHKSFTAGSAAEKALFVSELVASFKRFGFVKLKNHSVEMSTIDELFSRRLERDRHRANIWPLCGLKGGRPSTQLKDAKQHYDIGPPIDEMYPNQWLSEDILPGWRNFMENYWMSCQELSLSIIAAIEQGLNMPKGTIATRCVPSASEVRLNHYPEVATSEILDGSTARIWPHTDFGIITLLLTDDVGGLEIQDTLNPGTFLPVTQGSKGEMVVNVADTLERWTNGVLKAGLHRVMLPPEAQDGSQSVVPERWSIPYLFKARREVSVGPLPQFVADQRPSLFDDITALQFQLRRQHQVYTDAQLEIAVN